ncbi:hypothetical protein PG987_005978 [Apiospora arundinis]
MATLTAIKIAPRAYKFRKDTTTKLHNCFDPWHDNTYGAEAEMQACAHSIEAYTEHKSLEEWRPELLNALSEEAMVQPDCHEIVRGLSLATTASGTGQYPFAGTEDGWNTRLWDQIFTGAVKLEDKQQGGSVVSWIESLKSASERKGAALQRLMVQRIREKRQGRICSALQISWDRPAQVASNPSSPPKNVYWHSAAMFLSSVDTALLQVQVSLVAFAVVPETKAEED